MSSIGFCPECGQRLKVGGRPRVGQKVVCTRCEANLEVINPVTLDLDVYVPVPKPRSNAAKRAGVEIACPECGNRLYPGAHPRLGQPIICPVCRTHLEIVNLNPLELDEPVPDWTSTDRRFAGERPAGQKHSSDRT